MLTENSSVVYVAKRPLGTGADRIEVDQIIDTTGWSERVLRAHVDLGWIVPLLVTDQEAVDQQWAEEEQQREERRKAAPEPEPVEAPKPPLKPPPAYTLFCMNCGAPYGFADLLEFQDRFQCEGCNQEQTVAEAKEMAPRMATPLYFQRTPSYFRQR